MLTKLIGTVSTLSASYGQNKLPAGKLILNMQQKPEQFEDMNKNVYLLKKRDIRLMITVASELDEITLRSLLEPSMAQEGKMTAYMKAHTESMKRNDLNVDQVLQMENEIVMIKMYSERAAHLFGKMISLEGETRKSLESGFGKLEEFWKFWEDVEDSIDIVAQSIKNNFKITERYIQNQSPTS